MNPEALRQCQAQGASRPLGQLLIELGYVHPDQLAKALEAQRGMPADERVPIGRICVEMGFLTPDRLESVLDRWGKRLRLGELLVHRGRISLAQLEVALRAQRERAFRIGEILLELGFLDEPTLTETLAEQFDLPYVPLGVITPHPELAELINPLFAWRNGVVPVARIGRQLTVAIHDPTRRDVVRDLEQAIAMKVRPVVSTRSEVQACLRRLYEEREGTEASDGAATAPAGAMATPAAGYETGGGARAGGDGATGIADDGMFPPLDLREGLEIPSLVRRLITQALRTHVHDLHFEPAEEGGRVRIRDDGGLREWEEAAAATGKIPALVRAVKAMAHLEPGETRRPQEGIVVLKTEEGDFSRPVRLRVSILPGPSGETAVLQILREERSDPTLEEAGLSAFVRSRFEPLLREGRGVLLVTGPIGSRKRTTLRATVPLLRGPNVKILSAEDPIFSVIRGVTQAQVDPSLGNTFARYLRAFLDQGADVILCDRIDDGATAQIAFSVGPEGPTILGTTNAGNSTAVVGRMVELGVDRNQVAASLSGILAQRLIRRNCPSCSVPYRPAARVLEEWFRGSIPDVEWRRGSGCDRCGGTGHAGRAIAAELWIPTAEDRYAIGQRLPAEALREQALGGFPCVGQDALRLALEGTITLEEALKVVPYEDVVLARRCGLEPAARRPRGEHEAPIVKVA